MRRLAAWTLVAFCVACTNEPPPRAQWVVTLSTDAPLPPFFDRVVVEMLDDQGELACGSACRRVFGFTDASAWPLSFGIAATNSPTHVRARLYRTDHASDDGLPLAPMLVDALGKLPPVDGITPVSLELRMVCFGVASDVAGGKACNAAGTLADEPVLAASASPLVMGSWAPAEPVPCAFDVPPSMVCHPGGVFFLGGLIVGSPIQSTIPEHLVQLSPFALDMDEMTVGEVRKLVESGALSVMPIVKDADKFADKRACTWLGPTNPEADAMPMNCISPEDAALVCAALGKRLPTEAEFEWAAGNTTLETDYPWGADTNACEHAVVGRGRSLGEALLVESPMCRVRASTGLLPWGPIAGGHPRDVTKLGIKNLSGNLSEWVADKHADFEDPCWGPPTKLVVDPRCDTPSRSPGSGAVEPAVRGGSWAFVELAARSISRGTEGPSDWERVGFRCAKSK